MTADSRRATCATNDQLQPLFPGAFFSCSVPPAPEEPPLHPLAEPPAPALSPLQALLPDAQPPRVKDDPAIRPAMQKPARIFFRSSTSISASLKVDAVLSIFPGAETQWFFDHASELTSAIDWIDGKLKKNRQTLSGDGPPVNHGCRQRRLVGPGTCFDTPSPEHSEGGERHLWAIVFRWAAEKRI